MRFRTLEQLRRHAIARTFFKPTTLGRAIARMGFVQADPIRAPARAQDLMLRHRVVGYRAGDLEQRYPTLPIEEDFFINYGFLPRATNALMHPRVAKRVWPASRLAQANDVLAFVRARKAVHPREVDAHFQHGKALNWFGGSSNASTQLLDEMHYRGMLRIARRDGGVRVYAAREFGASIENEARAHDALIDVAINLYAPLPAASLGYVISSLKGGAPQWQVHRNAALARAKSRLSSTRIEGVDWYWPSSEKTTAFREEGVRLLAPFDPLVWDRRRFELFWGWAYRFEAYTPAAKRVRGYYALPMLWRDDVIGWANLSVRNGELVSAVGYQSGAAPREPAFKRELAAELERIRAFLGIAMS